VNPEILRHPGDISRILAAFFRFHLDNITILAIKFLLPEYLEAVIVQVRRTAEVVIGKVGTEKRVVLG